MLKRLALTATLCSWFFMSVSTQEQATKHSFATQTACNSARASVQSAGAFVSSCFQE